MKFPATEPEAKINIFLIRYPLLVLAILTALLKELL